MSNLLKHFILKPLLLTLTALGLWNYSQAQRLEDILQQADTSNLMIRAAQLEYQSTLARVNGAGVLPDPQLTVSVAGSHLETRLGPQQARVTLMQMFPWFGSLDAEKQREAIMAQVAYHEYLDQRNTLFYELSQQYYDLYEANKTILLLDQSLELMNSMEEVAIQRYQEAKTSMVDVLKIQIRKEEMETELALLEERVKVLNRTINLILNQPSTAAIVVPDTLLSGEIAPGSDLTNNPRLASLRQMKEATDWSATLAKKKGFPMVGLGLDYVVIGKGDGITLDDNGRDAWMPMITLGVPIYRRKYRAEVRSAEVLRESIAAGHEGKTNELLSEMETVNYEAFKTAAMAELLAAKISKTRQALSVQLSSYASDGEMFEELLLTRQQLLAFRIEMEKVLVEGLKAEAKRKFLTNSYHIGEENN